jgi:hypothetical protein
VAVVAAVMVVLAGCGDGGSSAGSSATPAPSASYDKATVRACKLADKAGQSADDAAFKAAADAVSVAATSDVAALRDISAKYAAAGTRMDAVNAQTGAIRISTWCLDHGLSKPGN